MNVLGVIGFFHNYYKALRCNYSDYKRIQNIQNRRLRNLLRHAVQNSEFYRELYDEIDVVHCRLGELPVITKPVMMDNFDRLITDPRLRLEEIQEWTSEEKNFGKLYLNRIIEASTRMNNLIEDLLILSRVGRKFTEKEIMDLNVLLNNIINDLESTLKEKNGKIVVENLPTIKIQKTWMSQLFTNLIDNGIKFNESEEPTIHIGVKKDELNYIFFVKDNGIGIEKQYQEKVFGLFERLHTRDEYDGSGAGLAICKKIVEELINYIKK